MDRIREVDKMFKRIASMLPKVTDPDKYYLENKEDFFFGSDDGTEILSTEESEVDAIANLFDQLYEMGTTNTGYYDPEEDERNGEVNEYTGFYYVTIA